MGKWQSVVSIRVNGSLCPVYADRKVLMGVNDLTTTDSDTAEEWDSYAAADDTLLVIC